MPNIKFTTDDKFEAAALYYQYGNYREVERQTEGRISARLCKYWHDNDDKFSEGMDKASRVADKKLSAKFLQLANGCVDEMLARLKDPEALKKIYFRELSMTGGIYHDKRQVIEGKATSIRGTSKGEMERLNELAEEMNKRHEAKGLASVERFRKVESA